ncbi:hypothetical protein TrCOL_g4328 [Triparma columacea]|uniref:Uncharacterized protein n=1 Tax=Triparma columacea TaxID=722753 RepID=A0A9W7GQF6_9STRA|nr:hypothetical protein TrCOL_g4328 [Triparma columacea]
MTLLNRFFQNVLGLPRRITDEDGVALNFTYYGTRTSSIRLALRRISISLIVSTIVQTLLLFLNLFTTSTNFPPALIVYEALVFSAPLMYTQAGRTDRVFNILGLVTMGLGIWGLSGFVILFTDDKGSFESTPLFLYSRIQLGGEQTYKNGEFWVSVGVLAILNLVVACIYIVISVTCFRLLHIYRLRLLPPPRSLPLSDPVQTV